MVDVYEANVLYQTHPLFYQTIKIRALSPQDCWEYMIQYFENYTSFPFNQHTFPTKMIPFQYIHDKPFRKLEVDIKLSDILVKEGTQEHEKLQKGIIFNHRSGCYDV